MRAGSTVLQTVLELAPGIVESVFCVPFSFCSQIPSSLLPFSPLPSSALLSLTHFLKPMTKHDRLIAPECTTHSFKQQPTNIIRSESQILSRGDLIGSFNQVLIFIQSTLAGGQGHVVLSMTSWSTHTCLKERSHSRPGRHHISVPNALQTYEVIYKETEAKSQKLCWKPRICSLRTGPILAPWEGLRLLGRAREPSCPAGPQPGPGRASIHSRIKGACSLLKAKRAPTGKN